MKKKSGFTLAELLCVIVILGVVSVIATAGVIEMSRKTKENLYCSKVKLIKEKAKEYGEKHELELTNSTLLYEGYKSIKITIQDLVGENLVEVDKNNLVLNPIDDTSMNHKEIILYLKNNQIYVFLDDDNVCEI